MTLKLKITFGLKRSQCYNGCLYEILRNLQTTSGLSILLHRVISLPDVTSCDTLGLYIIL